MKALRFLAQHLLALFVASVLVVAADALGAVYFRNFPPESRFIDSKNAKEAHFVNWQSRGAANTIPEFFKMKRPMIFGSSELWAQTAYLPSHYLPRVVGQDVLTFGHQGNQSLTYLINLMDFHRDIDENSRLVFLISPCWFYGRGLETHAFFEYIQPEALLKIRYDQEIPEIFKQPIAAYLKRSSTQINGLVAEKFAYQAPKFMSDPLEPVISFFKVSVPQWLRSHSRMYRELAFTKRQAPFHNFAGIGIDWEQSYRRARALVLSSTNNNEFGIQNRIWAEHIQGTVPRPHKPPKMDGHEIADLKALVTFLAHKKAHALFIMQPINRNVYTGSENFAPMSKEIAQLMKANNMDYVDFTTMPFEKVWMDDILHMSDFGWLKMDEVIAKWFIASR